MKHQTKQTLGVISGNRDFFPDKLVAAARIEILAIPQDMAVLAGLLEMQFTPDASTGVLHRLVPARSAA
jgi:hypothetical protein